MTRRPALSHPARLVITVGRCEAAGSVELGDLVPFCVCLAAPWKKERKSAWFFCRRPRRFTPELRRHAVSDFFLYLLQGGLFCRWIRARDDMLHVAEKTHVVDRSGLECHVSVCFVEACVIYMVLKAALV